MIANEQFRSSSVVLDVEGFRVLVTYHPHGKVQASWGVAPCTSWPGKAASANGLKRSRGQGVREQLDRVKTREGLPR